MIITMLFIDEDIHSLKKKNICLYYSNTFIYFKLNYFVTIILLLIKLMKYKIFLNIDLQVL